MVVLMLKLEVLSSSCAYEKDENFIIKWCRPFEDEETMLNRGLSFPHLRFLPEVDGVMFTKGFIDYMKTEDFDTCYFKNNYVYISKPEKGSLMLFNIADVLKLKGYLTTTDSLDGVFFSRSNDFCYVPFNKTADLLDIADLNWCIASDTSYLMFDWSGYKLLNTLPLYINMQSINCQNMDKNSVLWWQRVKCNSGIAGGYYALFIPYKFKCRVFGVSNLGKTGVQQVNIERELFGEAINKGDFILTTDSPSSVVDVADVISNLAFGAKFNNSGWRDYLSTPIYTLDDIVPEVLFSNFKVIKSATSSKVTEESISDDMITPMVEEAEGSPDDILVIADRFKTAFENAAKTEGYIISESYLGNRVGPEGDLRLGSVVVSFTMNGTVTRKSIQLNVRFNRVEDKPCEVKLRAKLQGTKVSETLQPNLRNYGSNTFDLLAHNILAHFVECLGLRCDAQMTVLMDYIAKNMRIVYDEQQGEQSCIFVFRHNNEVVFEINEKKINGGYAVKIRAKGTIYDFRIKDNQSVLSSYRLVRSYIHRLYRR